MQHREEGKLRQGPNHLTCGHFTDGVIVGVARKPRPAKRSASNRETDLNVFDGINLILAGAAGKTSQAAAADEVKLTPNQKMIALEQQVFRACEACRYLSWFDRSKLWRQA